MVSLAIEATSSRTWASKDGSIEHCHRFGKAVTQGVFDTTYGETRTLVVEGIMMNARPLTTVDTLWPWLIALQQLETTAVMANRKGDA